jgi:hypothetical protein
LKIRFDIGKRAREFFFGGDAGFGVFALLQDGLRFLLVVPEVRCAAFLFERFQEFAIGGSVKDSSGRARCVFSARRNAIAGLQCARLWAYPYFCRITRKHQIESRTIRRDVNDGNRPA